MLTLPTNFVAAFERADVRPRFWVEIDNGVTQWTAVSGSMDPDSDLYAVPEGVVSVSSIGSELDPLTRIRDVSECVVTFEDAYLRPIIVANRLRGKRISVKLGTAELSLADFVEYFSGSIEELQPDPSGETIQIAVMDVFAILKNTTITHTVWNKHPLEHIEAALVESDVAASLYDATSLDPSQPEYATISHYVVSKNANLNEPNSGAIAIPVPAFDIISELGQLLFGQLVVREDGKLRFVLYDPAASPVAHWGSDQILADTFQQTEDPLDNLINQVQLSFWLDFDLKTVNTLFLSDTASQSNYAYPGTTGRVATWEYSTKWVNGWCHFIGDADGLIQIADTTIEAEGGILHHFTGFNQWNAGPQPAWAQVGPTRPAYLQLRDFDRRSLKGQETVKCEQINFGPDFSHLSVEDLPSGGGAQSFNPDRQPTNATFASLTRGFLATPQVWDRDYSAIWDITILYDLGVKILERFADGFYRVELETSFSEYAIQVGDVITLTWPQFVGYNLDGLDSSFKWEVIDKEPDVYADPPRIKWTLASIGANTPTVGVGTFDNGTRSAKEGFGQANGATFTPYVLDQSAALNTRSSDYSVTDSGGLTIDVTPGTASDGRGAIELLNGYTGIPVLASKDNYVYVDTRAGAVNIKSKTLGAAPPVTQLTEAPIAKVVTDATSIVHIEDLRTSGSLSGTRLSDDSAATGIQQNETGRAALNQNFNFSQRSRG